MDDARTHGDEGDPDIRFSLANERTFLAWGRTCLAFVAMGLALARLIGSGTDDPLTFLAGIALIVVGAALALWAYANYRRNDEAIRSRGPLPRSSLPLVLLTTVAAAAVVAIALSMTG